MLGEGRVLTFGVSDGQPPTLGIEQVGVPQRLWQSAFGDQCPKPRFSSGPDSVTDLDERPAQEHAARTSATVEFGLQVGDLRVALLVARDLLRARRCGAHPG